jgi:excisionase family DNA binding protein
MMKENEEIEMKKKGTQLEEHSREYYAARAELHEHQELTNRPRHMDSGLSQTSIFDNGIVKLVWNVEDVARELECSVRHVRKLVSENKIPYLKIGRLVRFSPLRVREWLHKGGTR